MALFETVFAALNRYEVRYVVVGGLAVVLHGHPRLTGDLDLAVDLTPAAAADAVAAFTARRDPHGLGRQLAGAPRAATPRVAGGDASPAPGLAGGGDRLGPPGRCAAGSRDAS